MATVIDTSNLDVASAQKFLDTFGKDVNKDYAQIKLFIDGDHWQSGKGWTGPVMVDEKSPEQAAAANLRIQNAFTSQNAILEVVGRHVAGVIGREPNWFIKSLSDQEKAENTAAQNKVENTFITELDASLVKWWDSREMLIRLQEATAIMLWARRVCLRIFIPTGEVKDGDTTKISAEDMDKALSMIYVDVVYPDKGAVYTDPATMKRTGIYVTEEPGSDTAKILEYSHVVDDMTIVTVVRSGSVITGDGLNLRGHILMYQMERHGLITPQVIQNQKSLNKALTMWSTNMDWSAFVERIILNGAPPGEWKKDENGKEVFHPAPLAIGPGKTNFIVGVEQQEIEQGKQVTKYATPSVQFREPIKTETFDTTATKSYRNILQEVKQLHAFISGDATPSGESRVQAMADFISDLRVTKTRVDAAGRWLLQTVLYLAGELCGKTTQVDDVKIAFECILNPGPIPAELAKQILEQYKAKLKSRFTAMSELGIDDPEAEAGRIDTAIDDVDEMFRLIRTSGLNLPSLMKELVAIAISDKDILSGLSEETKTQIQAEIDQSARERSQGDAASLIFGT